MHNSKLIRRRHIALPLGLLVATALGLAAHAKAADTPTDIVLTKDALTVNKGTYVCNDDRLKTISRYVIAGTFYSNAFVSPKFPCGGDLRLVVPTSAASRLNPDATMVFDGGYLFLDAARGEQEQVRQIQFLSGMSEIRMENGGDDSTPTTLRATDPDNALVRNQGATLMIGGDEKRSQPARGLWVRPMTQPGLSKALGAAEELMFASGVANQLKGAGGPAGSKNVSIIPWMVGGTYLYPGMGGMVTYDAEKGIRCLRPEEYDTQIKGMPDRNVWPGSIQFGKNNAQTVNALIFSPYFSEDLDPGSTLTITSGFLQFGQRGPSTIGSHPQGADYISHGTINFGPAEGVIWTCFETEWGPNVIGPVIAGSGGLTVAGSNTLILLGANTYTGRTCVSAGVLQIGDVFPSKARLGNGDVEVAAGATLRIMPNTPDAIPHTTTITLLNAGTSFYGVLDLQPGVNETVAGLILDGKPQAAGTYGGKASTAPHKLDNYFAGPGILTVAGKPK